MKFLSNRQGYSMQFQHSRIFICHMYWSNQASRDVARTALAYLPRKGISVSIMNSALISIVLCFVLVSVPAMSGAAFFGPLVSSAIEDAQIAKGMSQSEVEQALGEPIDKHGYVNSVGGITWTYELKDNTSSSSDYIYEVDFSMDRRVVSSGKRALFIY